MTARFSEGDRVKIPARNGTAGRVGQIRYLSTRELWIAWDDRNRTTGECLAYQGPARRSILRFLEVA
jgi:hypothetical protein